MIAEKRRANILEIINKQDFASVENLATLMDVSPMTIRRDLQYLSTNGLLKRCHGGAILNTEVSFVDKTITNPEAKELIAEKAVSLIKDNKVIFLDSGTTTFKIAKKLVDRGDLTIVTNDLEIAYFLRNAEPTVFVAGGKIQKGTGCLLGAFTNNIVDNFNFDISFIGTACVDDNFCCSTPTLEKVSLKTGPLLKDVNHYLVVDSSKFYKRSLFRLSAFEDFTGVITDKNFNKDEIAIIKSRKINIINT